MLKTRSLELASSFLDPELARTFLLAFLASSAVVARMRPSLSLELIASLGLLLPGAQSVRFGSPAPAINFQTIDKQIPARKQSLDHLNSRYSPEALQVLRLSLNEPELLHQVQHEGMSLTLLHSASLINLFSKATFIDIQRLDLITKVNEASKAYPE